jgi:hypothetical protein
MLGGFDSKAFDGLPISDFSLLLIVIFTVIILSVFFRHSYLLILFIPLTFMCLLNKC